jgi:3-oxoacid CoA-transferase subunit B
MEHCSKNGQPKIVNSCSLPLTGKGVVNRIITDMAVIDVTTTGLVLKEIAPGYSVEDVQLVTESKLRIDPLLKTIDVQ